MGCLPTTQPARGIFQMASRKFLVPHRNQTPSVHLAQAPGQRSTGCPRASPAGEAGGAAYPDSGSPRTTQVTSAGSHRGARISRTSNNSPITNLQRTNRPSSGALRSQGRMGEYQEFHHTAAAETHSYSKSSATCHGQRQPRSSHA